MNGKGDRYRPYDPENFGRGYDRIFRKDLVEGEKKEEDSDRFSPPEFEQLR